MINTNDIEADKLSVTIALISKEAAARGWQVMVPYSSSPLAFIDRGYGEPIRIFSATPPTTSYAAAYLANDKLATHSLLESKKFPLMETVLVDFSDNSFNAAKKLLESFGAVVAKPIDAGHGKGITTNIDTEQGLRQAIEYAKQYSKSSDSVIVQKMYVDPIDLRLLCIDGNVVAGAIRQPASVNGDGHSTIAELITQENRDKRGVPYRSDLAFIDENRALQFLGDRSNDIPRQNEKVAVLGTANVGSGGESIDCTDTLPEWIKDLAREVASSACLPVCGVDFMVTQVPKPDSTEEILNPVITEINKCPSFGLHHSPTTGKPRNVTKAYLDYLEKI